MSAPSRILTLNAGSSSLKWAIFAGDERVASGTVARFGRVGPAHSVALTRILDSLGTAEVAGVQAVGHRVVHGGPLHTRACGVTPQLVADLRPLAVLDPDHLPASLAIMDEVGRRLPHLPQVACFDTSFFSDLPDVARRLPLPRRHLDNGVRRYGFHGLSYTYLMEELGRVAPVAAGGRVILAHLGSGASMAAVFEGRCIETTMGFTPNSGLMMGTRSGDVEPGILLHLLRSGHDVNVVDDVLNHQSGLLGVSGTSADLRDLLAAEADNSHAAEAVDLFCYQAVKAVGALAATLGGLDALVFSGGIGENAAPVRQRISERLAHLGVDFDPIRNQTGSGVISSAESRVVVRILPTDEASVIARQTIAVLTDGDLP